MKTKTKPRAKEKTLPCVHCERMSKRIRRGLCEPCYRDPEIRAAHENLSCRREPTKEEIEAMVAEGYAELPWWWDRETRRMAAGLDE